MRNTVFPHWLSSLTTLFLLAQSLYLSGTHKNSWLAILISGAIAIVIFYGLRKLCKNVDLLAGSDFRSLFCGIIIAIASVWLVKIDLQRLSRFFAQTAFPTLSRLAAVCLIVITVLLLSRNGRTCLAMWALPTLIIIMIPFTLSMALTVPDWHPTELLPLFDDNSFGNTIISIFVSTYLPLLFLFLLYSGKGCHSFTPGILLGTCLLALTDARNLMLLGSGLAAELKYPTYSAAGLVSIGDFFQRAESLIAGCLTLCAIARMSVLLLTAAHALKPLLALRRNKLLPHKKTSSE